MVACIMLFPSLPKGEQIVTCISIWEFSCELKNN